MRRLRERYSVVLVDEFQDTDPVQWDILRRAFGGGDVALVLIGDPKQAIYAFRGADVYAYLDAAKAARTRETLSVNRRSDQELIDAYDALLGGTRLGHPDILYRQVRAAHTRSRLTARRDAPLRIRLVERGTHGMALTAKGFAEKSSTRDHVARDLAGDVVRLLTSGARCGDRAGGTSPCSCGPTGRRRWCATRSPRPACPAVINGAGSVFATRPAKHWLRLLEAIERPSSTLRAHACALTPFLGWSAERVASASEEEWERSPRAAAPVGAGAAAGGRRVAERADHAGRGAAAAGARGGRRRARADRPAPRRPAPARRGARGGARAGRADRVAAPPDRGRRAGDRAWRSTAAAWSPTTRRCRS